MIRVFTRTWWKENKSGRWPNNLEPCMGRKYTIARVQTEAEAIRICKEYNATHAPGKYSKKAEYEIGG